MRMRGDGLSRDIDEAANTLLHRYNLNFFSFDSTYITFHSRRIRTPWISNDCTHITHPKHIRSFRWIYSCTWVGG